MNPTTPEDQPRQTPRGYFSYRGKTSAKTPTPTLDDNAAGPAPWLPALTPARSRTHLPTPTDTASTAGRPGPRRSGPPRTRYRGDPLLDATLRLQARDRVLTRLLDEHRTLTTDQIAAVLFTSPATCRNRLYRLRQGDWLDRFVPLSAATGSGTHWVLGTLATQWAAGQDQRPPPSTRAGRDQRRAIAANPHGKHDDGARQVFIDLLVHARHHPGTRLARWWSPKHTAEAAGQRLHPDGHGVWEQHHPTPPAPSRSGSTSSTTPAPSSLGVRARTGPRERRVGCSAATLWPWWSATGVVHVLGSALVVGRHGCDGNDGPQAVWRPPGVGVRLGVGLRVGLCVRLEADAQTDPLVGVSGQVRARGGRSRRVPEEDPGSLRWEEGEKKYAGK